MIRIARYADTCSPKLIICLVFLSGTSLAALPTKAGDATPVEKVRQDSLRKKRLEKFSAFLSRNPPLSYSLDSHLGVPERLDGDLSTNFKSTDPVDAAREFFSLNKDLYGIQSPENEIRVVRGDTDRLTGTVLLICQQFYDGVLVRGGRVKVNFTPNAKLSGVYGRLYPDISLKVTSQIADSFATEIARRDILNQSSRVQIHSVSLQIIIHDERYILAWSVIAFASKPRGSWEYLIDASNGAILRRRDLTNSPSRPTSPVNRDRD